MQPLVAIEESQHVALAPEGDGFRGPCESHSLAALATRRVDHGLLESAKRDRHLQHDAPIVELAAGREVRPPPVAERLDQDVVIAAGEALQRLPGLGRGVAGKLGADGHGRPRICVV